MALVGELGAHEVVDYTQAGRTPVALDASDVEIGTWDAGTETWTVDEDAGDRVRVAPATLSSRMTMLLEVQE